MPRGLPSLNGFRAFEAAARHLSFTRAAAELNVTQAAISHRIKVLEEQLGVTLFKRLNRALLLTDEGQSLFPAVHAALEKIVSAVEDLHTRDVSRVLTVSTLDSFAFGWLGPRLSRFRDAHPDIDVRLATADHLVDFVHDDVDMAVRYGRGRWRGLNVVRLLTEELFPVCSPALLDQGPGLNGPEDLRHYTLLHDEMGIDWRMWLMAAGVTTIDPTRGPWFIHSQLVTQAAIAAEGVALGRSVLVADDLKAGRLVKPFDISLPAEYAYYIVCPTATASRPKIRAFRNWLLEEAG
jgi:LysR family transcriptional regulator, glycine cleavage system transcriptional activator